MSYPCKSIFTFDERVVCVVSQDLQNELFCGYMHTALAKSFRVTHNRNIRNIMR